MPTLDQIVREIDRRAQGRPFGTLQPRRKRIHQLRRMPAHVPFGGAANERWAIHAGGRTELQFNLGLEDGLPGGDLRYGVAFSFETSQTLPQIDILLPKVARFNDYLREKPGEFTGFLMWHFDNGRIEATRHGPYPPCPIPPDLFRRDVFVFLGRIGDANHPDYGAILDTFDTLLPLWESVESKNGEVPPSPREPPLGRRRPSTSTATVGTRAELTLNIELRHNAIQRRLYEALVEEHGEDCVGIEYEARGGGRVDAIVRTASERILYEIKTASTARACVREALGQLLDYGCWPGRDQATRLVIVGAAATTEEVQRFLARLSGLVPLRIEYRQVSI